jgi:hypothetical protein
MGKHFSLAALAAVGLAGCGGGGSSVITSPPDTNASQSVVTVYTSEVVSSEDIIQVPLVGGNVTLSRTVVGHTPESVITTGVTNSSGQVTFSALPSSGPLCVSILSAGTFASKCRQPFPATVTLQVSSQT